MYDHQPPQTRTVNPGDKNWDGQPGNPDPPFDFTWLGVRVPAILISPYIKPGSIDSTLYDHTSVIATARKFFLANWQNTSLTERDKAAKTFEANITENVPRTDKINFPQGILPMFGGLNQAQRLNLALTDHQKQLVQMAAYLEGLLPAGKHTKINPAQIATEGAAAEYLRQVMALLHASAPSTATAARP